MPLKPVRELVLAALFASLTAVGAWLTLSLPFVSPVPLTLQTLFVLLSGLLLGPRYGFYSQLVYLGLGAAGVPVFSGFHSGLGWLAGPTGGYLLSYPLAAGLAGLIVGPKSTGYLRLSAGAGLGLALIYALGVTRLWFFLSSKAAHAVPLWAALGQGMLPFILPDLLKAAVAVFVAVRVKTALAAARSRVSPPGEGFRG